MKNDLQGTDIAVYIFISIGFWKPIFIKFKNQRGLQMISGKFKPTFFEGKYSKRFLVVPFGAIFLFVCMIGWGNPDAKPGARDKKRKQNEQRIVELRKYLGKLSEINEKRSGFHTEQDQLLDRINILKDKNQTMAMGPDKILARRELEKTAGELHKILEEDRRMNKNQQTIIKKLLQNKEETFELLKTEKKNLEKQINRMEKESDAPSEKTERVQNQLREIEKLVTSLEILDNNPDALSVLGLRPGDRWSPRGSQRRQTGAYLSQKAPPTRMETAIRQRGAVRIWQQLRSLEKQMQFLREQMNRTESELHNLQNIMHRIEERHPDFFEEIKYEPPPPPPKNRPKRGEPVLNQTDSPKTPPPHDENMF